MSFSTEGLARACAVHPKRTVAVWGAVVLASLAVIAVLLGSALTTDADVTTYIRSVVDEKEEGHRINAPDFVPPSRTMVFIGG